MPGTRLSLNAFGRTPARALPRIREWSLSRHAVADRGCAAAIIEVRVGREDRGELFGIAAVDPAAIER